MRIDSENEVGTLTKENQEKNCQLPIANCQLPIGDGPKQAEPIPKGDGILRFFNLQFAIGNWQFAISHSITSLSDSVKAATPIFHNEHDAHSKSALPSSLNRRRYPSKSESPVGRCRGSAASFRCRSDVWHSGNWYDCPLPTLRQDVGRSRLHFLIPLRRRSQEVGSRVSNLPLACFPNSVRWQDFPWPPSPSSSARAPIAG